jgi:hypothetical protein
MVQCICNKTAHFGFKGDKKPSCCNDCKKSGMLNITSKKCPCGKRMHFGFKGDKKPSCCNNCKKDGMVNLTSKTCKCGKRMNFGFPNDKKPTCCNNCKLDGMINITSPRCECGQQKIFGYPNTKATHCNNCKLDGMVNVKHNMCITCHKKRAWFADVNDTKPKYCTQCKTDNMVDIVNFRCKCNKYVNFGFPNDKKPTCCNNCKLDGMVNITSKTCLCGKRMNFGFPNDTRPTCCNDCKKDGMVDIKNIRCKSCNLYQAKTKPYLCSYCIPDSSKKQKTSEMILKKFLDDNKVEHTYNKSVGYVCGNYRPDFLIDCNTHFIVVENDEDQHRQYEQECEVARMHNIEQSLGLRCLFIRYNPDTYKIDSKVVRIQKNTRMKYLLERINYYKSIRPTKPDLHIEYLYYDK